MMAELLPWQCKATVKLQCNKHLSLVRAGFPCTCDEGKAVVQ